MKNTTTISLGRTSRISKPDYLVKKPLLKPSLIGGTKIGPTKPIPIFRPSQINAIKKSGAGIIPAGLPQMNKKLAMGIADSPIGQLPSLIGGSKLTPPVGGKVPYYQRPTAEQRAKGMRW